MMLIDITKNVYELVKDNPKLKRDWIEMGFEPLANEKMLHTVGRMVSPKKGAKQIGISVETLVRKLEDLGYEVKGHE